MIKKNIVSKTQSPCEPLVLLKPEVLFTASQQSIPTDAEDIKLLTRTQRARIPNCWFWKAGYNCLPIKYCCANDKKADPVCNLAMNWEQQTHPEPAVAAHLTPYLIKGGDKSMESPRTPFSPSFGCLLVHFCVCQVGDCLPWSQDKHIHQPGTGRHSLWHQCAARVQLGSSLTREWLSQIHQGLGLDSQWCPGKLNLSCETRAVKEN